MQCATRGTSCTLAARPLRCRGVARFINRSSPIRAAAVGTNAATAEAGQQEQQQQAARRRLYDLLKPLPLVAPVCALAGSALALTQQPTGGGPLLLLLAFPVLMLHVFSPLADTFIGEQPLVTHDNQHGEGDGSVTLVAFAALHTAAWLTASVAAGAVARAAATSWDSACLLGALAMGLGGSMAVSLGIGHELAHRRGAFLRALGGWQLALAQLSGYARAHMHHHLHVGLETDYATARQGEGFYHFLVRYHTGTFRVAWQEEVAEASRRKRPLWGPGNATLVSLVLQAVTLAVSWGLGGVPALAVHLGAATFSAVELAGMDYIFHYGLTRARKADGTHAPFTASLAFNSGFPVENSLLVGVLQHSSHHLAASKPYPLLGFSQQDAASPTSTPEDQGARAPRFGYGLPMLLMAATLFVPPVFLPLAQPLSERANLAHRREVQALP